MRPTTCPWQYCLSPAVSSPQPLTLSRRAVGLPAPFPEQAGCSQGQKGPGAALGEVLCECGVAWEPHRGRTSLQLACWGVCAGEGAKDEPVPVGMGLWGVSFPAQPSDLCNAELL